MALIYIISYTFADDYINVFFYSEDRRKAFRLDAAASI